MIHLPHLIEQAKTKGIPLAAAKAIWNHPDRTPADNAGHDCKVCGVPQERWRATAIANGEEWDLVVATCPRCREAISVWFARATPLRADQIAAGRTWYTWKDPEGWSAKITATTEEELARQLAAARGQWLNAKGQPQRPAGPPRQPKSKGYYKAKKRAAKAAKAA